MLKRAKWSDDPIRVMSTMKNYTSRSSFSYRILHFKGEEVLRSIKRPVDCPPNVDNDSHRHDHVNLFHPRITIFIAQLNVVENVGMQQLPCCSNVCSPLVSRGDLELKENIRVDGLCKLNATHLIL